MSVGRALFTPDDRLALQPMIQPHPRSEAALEATDSKSALRAELERLRERGRDAIDGGEYAEAEAIYRRAIELAQVLGDRREIDRFVCNRAAASIELGEYQQPCSDLREILLRSEVTENRLLASYGLARAHESADQLKKALFYAQMTRDRADQDQLADWQASALNLLGNILLAESRIDEAVDSYRLALRRMPSGPELWLGEIAGNLGYCRILQGRHQEGLTLLYQSLRYLRRAGAPQFVPLVHLALCWALLDLQRFGHAERHARRALEIAEEFGDSRMVKNALYLLGECSALTGDSFGARRWFDRLQRDHFPEFKQQNGSLSEILLQVDVRTLVNLKA